MITRRRAGGVINIKAPSSPEVEITDAVETIVNLPSPLESLPSEDIDVDLDDLFGLEELKWAFERDSASPLFDAGLTELGVYHDSGTEASSAPSPEREYSDLRMKSKRNQASHTTKNAIAARLNRLKKKEYVGGLEQKVGCLSTENRVLKQENSQLTRRVEELEDETRYLRAVLANESTLAQLLSRLSGLNGMKLSSSLFCGPGSTDHDYALPRKRVKVEEKETSGGVCLHVDQNHVSVEFCTKCAKSASTSLKM